MRNLLVMATYSGYGFFNSLKACIFCSIFLFFLQIHAYDARELITQGSACNNFLLYEKALDYLDEAIRLNPSSKVAYEERAITHFELNRIDLALQDYRWAKGESHPYYENASSSFTINEYSAPCLDFAKGLLHGSLTGGREETVEFLSSIRGSCRALWSFACSPVEVSKELIVAVRAVGEYLASASINDLVEDGLPEIIECGRYWDTWSEYEKGWKMGYILGKYGIGVFLYIMPQKAAYSIYSGLKRATMMATLERYSLSRSAVILQESAKCAAKNSSILKRAQRGYIVPKVPNDAFHTLTKHHHWDKVVKLTGNKEIDFKAVAAFLEKEKILSCKREIDYFRPNSPIQTYRYSKEIGKNKIVGVFEIREDGIPLFRNAWVEVMLPYKP